MLDHGVRQYVTDKLASMGVDSDPYGTEPTIIFLLAAVGVAVISYLIVYKIIVRTVNFAISKNKKSWGNSLINHEVLEKIALLVPVMILDLLIPPILAHHPSLETLSDRLLGVSVLVMFIWMMFALLDALHEIAVNKGVTRRMPVKSFVQLIKLFTFFVGIVVSVSILANESPVIFLSGLGVATGLVMLVFKDTILGFVAGIQLAANRMVSLNDWIEMNDYGANGSVEEVSLTTVKVRNFDNTVTMLPAYALVQNAFINWQGMSDSGGRRIMRSVNIDLTSIRFMTEEEIEALKEIRILREFLFEKSREIKEFNENLEDVHHAANLRQMTNVGVFRAYLTTYLRSHKDIHHYMLFMVRQLAPTAEGLPLQIYAFTNNTDWVFYEGVQADIFDHIYAIMPMFGLRPFQAFGGHDAGRIGLKE
ncbi:mechanosensitive ion channel protein MscS [Enterovibrio norvegicus FF-454]|uniref:Mechanosensitive ion channel protein MscS n=1 Tax=Enterovibrio norvegicus FF-454 TaxID=1185651 RepID=A0A1E5C3B2_9GAMM|nr:mechanosensitive ion channel family protein [Enterovibrio norvegicus]OEE59998.1 mechanosensitive ion channel protein MscS [Enterovibrio norvegicus FF-454]